MKSSLVFYLLLALAVAHGTEAMAVGKRDVQADVDRITKLIRDMSSTFTTTTQAMVEKMKTLEVTNTAQGYVEGSKAKIQPLVEQVHAGAAKLQEQLRPFISNVEGELKPVVENLGAQVKPLADNVHAQLRPLSDMMERFFQQVMDQTRALLPPQ